MTKPIDNFTAEDLQQLNNITDLAELKTRCIELINTDSQQPMKPEKIAWFTHNINGKNNPNHIIKLMWDLLLSGDGRETIGNGRSMKSNNYRNIFGSNR